MAIPLSTSTIPLTRSESAFPFVFSTRKHLSFRRSVSLGSTNQLTSVEVNSLTLGREKKEIIEAESEEWSSERKLEECWREIHGADDWVGMLDPIDPILRSELMRYGEMAQACYDAFDYDRYSVNCGNCKYTKDRFFKSLGMEKLGYKVTRYLFATSNINLPKFFKRSMWPEVWSKNANWIGYVAVSDDETTRRLGRRDITVAWRGTVTRLEWLHDLMDILQPVSSDKIPCHDPTVKVESGFVSLYTDKDNKNGAYCKLAAREQVLAEVSRLMEVYRSEEVSITVTGHSLGAALAVLSAFDLAETGLNVRRDGSGVPICVFSYSGPRVGNTRFRERLETLGVKVLRVHNVHDVVPMAPGLLVNERITPALSRLVEGFPWSYSHVGAELALDHRNSPFLKDTTDRVCAHNLEALLHLIDGYHGKGERFCLASKRDIALVNKACDFLKADYQIPPCWRQDENKGMVRTEDGRWIQPERPLVEDLHDDMHRHLRQLGLATE